ETNQPDAIFHIGACSDTLNTDLEFMMERNYLSTKWLVDWCKQNGKKIIYSSSAAIYGVDGSKPSNLYGWTKMLGEDYVVANGGIALRYFNVYGPGEEHKGKMASMVSQILNSENVKLFPNKPKRDFVYVDDVVRANFYALDYYEVLKGKWYDVGTTQSVEFEMICEILNKPYEYKNESEIPNGYQFNTKATFNNLMGGWQPIVDINEGIHKLKSYISKGKVSFVCTTYGRFNCVERIVAQYHAQTYKNKELIIFNTDEEHPYSLGFDDPSIIIVNNGTNYETGEPYQNRGQICRDAVTHATGDYFMLADDDDIYLPWHLEQAVDGIEESGRDAWKPEKSFFATQSNLSLVMNTMEASVIVKMDRIREIGFRSDITGYEGLSWYTKLRDERELDEHNTEYVPSYCFNWSDPAEIAGHKQSGNIGSPNNFENHKAASIDFALRQLIKLSNEKLQSVYQKYYDFLKENKENIN
ncbi:MAG: NAD-dependent epimerase/dehydratase family protein, partial [Flavobacteriaceae bacterium]|nr:NAD-dependent epimerase/dehydratase family protein [Flavobacteriaceae bacterium]